MLEKAKSLFLRLFAGIRTLLIKQNCMQLMSPDPNAEQGISRSHTAWKTSKHSSYRSGRKSGSDGCRTLEARLEKPKRITCPHIDSKCFPIRESVSFRFGLPGLNGHGGKIKYGGSQRSKGTLRGSIKTGGYSCRHCLARSRQFQAPKCMGVFAPYRGCWSR